MLPMPINFTRWIDEHRHLLKPPVGNKVIWENTEFVVMVVGGPNARADFHINDGEEFFHQIEGDMVLRVLENGVPKDIPIRAGEMLLLPGGVPHSPQRNADTVGLVIERKRRPDEIDVLLWICPKCNRELYRETFRLKNIERDLLPVIDRFYDLETNCTCTKCNFRITR